MSHNTSYCVCGMSATIKNYYNQWKNFPSVDRWVLLDVTGGDRFNPDTTPFKKVFPYTESDIRTNLKFDGNPSKKHFWNSYGNRNIIWFYAAFRMMNFYLHYPQYDYYWFFDDDVFCDNWNTFIDSFNNDTSDFLSYFLFKNVGVTSYPDVSEVSAPMHSFYSRDVNWFSRFPGDGDVIPTEYRSNLFGSFFAVTRFSNKALHTLVDVHKSGLYGYSEGFVPTILAQNNCTMKSLYLPDNTSPFYDVSSVKLKHKNVDITWGWL